MNPVLRELLQRPPAMDPTYLVEVLRLPDAEARRVEGCSGGISRDEVEFLTDVVAELRPRATLEVGLGFGVSALAICDALPPETAHRHIVIDPHQKAHWHDAGLHNLERAGFTKRLEFYEDTSYRVLPALEARGTRVDFAFVDGWHTFDFVLVDFFYIDRLLRPGGVVAFDDADWPSIRSALRFIVANLSYEVHRVLPPHATTKSRRRRVYERSLHCFRGVLGVVGPLRSVVARSLSAEAMGMDARFGLDGSCIALRKCGVDRRPVNHHVAF